MATHGNTRTRDGISGVAYATDLSSESVETLVVEISHGHELHDVPRRLLSLCVRDPNIVPVQLFH